MQNIELSHIYVIEDEYNTVKIGIAGNVTKCIETINQNTAYKIINQYVSPSCINAHKIEEAAHKHFAERRKKGEWFTIAFDDAVDYVKGHFVTQQLPLPVEQSQVVINNHQIPVLVHNNQRVVAFAMIDNVHERPEGTARKQFNDNREHFVENEDFYYLDFKKVSSLPEIRAAGIVPNSQGLTVFTQMGYLMLVKSFTDDLAWKVQRQLVARYFAQPTQPTLTPQIETFITAPVHDEVAKPTVSITKIDQDQVQDDTWEKVTDEVVEYFAQLTSMLIWLLGEPVPDGKKAIKSQKKQ